MTAAELLAAFQSYLAAHDGYIPNTSGEEWTQAKQEKATSESVIKYGSQWIGHRVEDCSGAFVRALKQYGLNIYHGSNRIARANVVELLPIKEAKPGMVAFKKRQPGQQYYDLPDEYKQGGRYYNGDLNDYYHIGTVDSDVNYVLNSQSVQNGFVRSKITQNWCCVAKLKNITYESEAMPVGKAYVTGGKLNLRKTYSTMGTIITKIPDGAEVEVLEKVNNDWVKVTWGGKTGYVMSKYLTTEKPDADMSLEEKVQRVRIMLEDALDLLGRG